MSALEQLIENPYQPEQRLLTDGMDYYKPTMSQLAFEEESDAEVTFTFKNRGEQRLMDYIDPNSLQQRFDEIRERGWTQDELAFLARQKNSDDEYIFTHEFLVHLLDNPLPEVTVSYDEEADDIAIETTGEWALATFWETVVMSEVNEMYFENYMVAHDIDPRAIYEEGNRRLSEKIAILQQRPDIKFSDFGTRRHFSYKWQQYVVRRLKKECPENLIGTSNVGLARRENLKPIGTFAHEMPMVFAGLAYARGLNVRDSHGNFLNKWLGRYRKDLAIGLTDTFTTDFFFEDFTRQQAIDYRGVRHDSGDPFAFGERLIKFYEAQGIDPKTKTVVFSDGLDIDTIIKLQDHFGDRIGTMYGWGTTLTNDMPIPPLNIVMKATYARDTVRNVGSHTVKLGDGTGKETGPEALRKEYRTDIFKAHELPLVA